MMVLIININYLVILICSTVFLLSSFVSSQQKLKNIEDPLEFYEYVLYLNAHYPDYYAKNYNRLNSHYKKLISAANAKVAKESPSNRGTSKRNLKQEPAVPRTTLKGDDFSRFTRKTSQDNNAGPFKSKSEGEVGKLHSRSLNSPETYANARREISDAETDWARNCLILGYNNTNGACQSEPEEIKQAPNQTICRSYFDFGCQYQSNRNLCVAAVNEVMKNISFNCDFNINGDSDLMSVQCCMACKSGMHTAIIKDSCNMHLDNSMPSFAQEKCCNTLLNPNTSDSTTELIKTGSLDEIFAHLEDRFSNSETDKSEIDGSTVPETSTLPTTTITTDTTTTPKPSTTTESNAAPSTTTESNAAPSTTMESNAAPSTTTTAIITELATMASNITAKSPILPETTTLEPTNTESTTRPLGLRSLDDEDSFHVEIPEGYRALEHQKNSYAKIDVKDKSKVDYLKILKKELVMKRSRKYKDFVLMDITQTNYSCDWEFKIEKAVAADDVATLTEHDFEPKSEKEKFILLINRDEIQPQTIQFSVACNLKEHKYFKYIVYLTIK